MRRVFMAYPRLHITKGPGERDLELAFIARRLGAEATFTIYVEDFGPILVGLSISNFQYVTCHGPKYKLGGQLSSFPNGVAVKLPAHNFIFVEYDAEQRSGVMEFSNAE